MKTLNISVKNAKQLEQVKAELQKFYPQKKISDDEIMGLMIDLISDSLSHMQEHHHHHDDHGCC